MPLLERAWGLRSCFWDLGFRVSKFKDGKYYVRLALQIVSAEAELFFPVQDMIPSSSRYPSSNLFPFFFGGVLIKAES